MLFNLVQMGPFVTDNVSYYGLASFHPLLRALPKNGNAKFGTEDGYCYFLANGFGNVIAILGPRGGLALTCNRIHLLDFSRAHDNPIWLCQC